MSYACPPMNQFLIWQICQTVKNNEQNKSKWEKMFNAFSAVCSFS